MLTPKRHVFVCVNERPPGSPLPCCGHRGGQEVYEALRQAVAAAGLNREVWVAKSGCLVQCNDGVACVVYPEGVWYGNLTLTDLPVLVREHFVGGRPVERLRLK